MNHFRKIKPLTLIFLSIFVIFTAYASHIDNPEGDIDIHKAPVASYGIINLGEISIQEAIKSVQQRMKQKWDGRRNYESQAKGAIGQAAAIALFRKSGYEPLDEHLKNRVNQMNPNVEEIETFSEGKYCNSDYSSREDHGIDGIFIKDGIIVINESKYRNGNRITLHKKDFGLVEDETLRQSSTIWNTARLALLPCYEEYQAKSPARTATLLNNNGELYLFGLSDQGKPIHNFSNTNIVLNSIQGNVNKVNFTTSLDELITKIQ